LEILEDIDQIGRIDGSNMLSLLLKFPAQCKEAVKITQAIEIPEKYKNSFSNILFTGMGGSAIGAHILICYLRDELDIPAIVNRDYTIPKFVREDTLAIFCSYSGNTEETLSAYEKAKRRTSNIVVLSSNGKLITNAQKDGFLNIQIPSGLPPRAALGYSFFPLLLLCSKLGLVKSKHDEINEVFEVLGKDCKHQIGLEIKSASNLAKQIAYKCHKKFPIVYGASDSLEAVVLRWRTQFSENSKSLSSTHVFPEMNHNEIVGWEFPEELLPYFIVIILRDSCEHPRVSKRIEITKKILEDNDIKTLQVFSLGNFLLSRLFSLIYIGDFSSFYLSILNRVDPTPVKRIDYLKRELAKVK